MESSITSAFPNSLVLIMDYESGEIPESMGGGLVASTASCLAVGTLSEIDGSTTVVLTDQGGRPQIGSLVFDGVLDLPSKEISVCDVENHKLLAMPTATRAKVQIFANHQLEPDKIVIIVRSLS